MFRINKTRLVPYGTTNEELSGDCSLSSTALYNGQSCAAWVIEKGNMDYLRKEVSW